MNKSQNQFLPIQGTVIIKNGKVKVYLHNGCDSNQINQLTKNILMGLQKVTYILMDELFFLH